LNTEDKIQQNQNIIRRLGLALGPLLFLFVMSLPNITLLSAEAQKVVAVAVWMLVWWVTEAVSLPVTALLPLILLPLTNVVPIKEAAAPYSSPIVYLFMGGFVIALAMEKWDLHLRIALTIVKLTGTHANGIILGFMIATAALSMWISNTATTVMMLPIASSVITLLVGSVSQKGQKNFALAIMLGVAYAANVGGVATLVGTPPNSVLAGFISTTYGYEIDFASWFFMGFPFSVVMLAITYFILVKWVYPNKLGHIEGSAKLINDKLQALGKISIPEKKVLFVFASTAICWISRGYINPYLPFSLTDPVIAMMGAIALFIVPATNFKSGYLLVWEDMQKLPWGILLLFGGGLSLASALSTTGVIELIGNLVSNNNQLSVIGVILLMTSVVLLMTEVMSNVALVAVFMPVVAGIATGLGVPVLWVAIPVTIASSCAFMLPMATPPNAIVFASGHIKVFQMVRAGILLNVMAILLLLVWEQSFVRWFFE